MAYRSRTRFSGIFNTPGFPPGVKWLLIVNVAIFLLGYFAGLLQLDRPLAYLVLSPVQVIRHGMIWQLVTYLFLHGSFGHIIWNMLALWMFGATLERTWGTRRFLNFYFFCGIGAGICVVLANYLLPWGSPDSRTIGCSGAIFGILMAYALLFPDVTMLWGFLIPIKVKYFVMIVGAVAFLSSFQVNSGVSEFAHLGGLLFGYIFIRKPRFQFDPLSPVRNAYKDWKLQRAKKKFQVYLRKQDSKKDPWVH
jgi:membrane associated rhomboid family serine protease